MTGILDLPTELISSIATYLDRIDLVTIRLVSRYVEEATFDCFAKRFFRKKGFMITSDSLQVLLSVAAHKELRKHVQHVWFNPDCFTFNTPDSAPFESHSHFKSRVQKFQSCIRDNEDLLSSTNLKHQLSAAFSSLPNLTTVGMRRGEDHSPWGWWKLQDIVGMDPRLLGSIPNGPLSGLSGPTRLFTALIKSLGASGVRLRRFYTDAIEIDSVPLDDISVEEVEAACRTIWYLEVNATRAWLEEDGLADSALVPNEGQYGDGLVKLLNAMPELREIGMMIFPDRQQRHLIPPRPRQPESWRYSYPFLTFEKLSQSLHLEQLRRVKLEKVTTSASTLIGFLKPCSSVLMSLKLRDLRLLSDEEVDDGRPWQPVFQFLNLDCVALEYILLNHLAHDHGGVRFVENPHQPPAPPAFLQDEPSLPRLPTVANAGDFADYETITVEEIGNECVKLKVSELIEQHWYSRNIFSYAMDEDIWHTDTSDEEW